MMTRRSWRRMKRSFKRNKHWIFLSLVILGLAVVAFVGCAPPQVSTPKSQEMAPEPRHDDFVAQVSGEKERLGDELELPPRETERPKHGHSIPYERDQSVPLDYWESCSFRTDPATGILELVCFGLNRWPHYYGPIARVHQVPARFPARALFF